ncbi:MAG: cell division protein FtsQ/DivIB [Chloroflexota bacterium]
MSSQRRRSFEDTPSSGVRRGAQVRPGMRLRLRAFIVSGRPLSVMLLVIVLYFTITMMWSNTYFVRTIVVEGATTMSTQRVSEIANVIDMPIWQVDDEAIAARLKTNPYVISASVYVQLPDTVRVVLREQQSEIRWKSGDWYLIVDPEGKVLGIDTAVVLSDTLVIHDEQNNSLVAGDMIDSEVLSLARDVYLRLPADAGVAINQISWHDQRGLSVRTASNQLVLIGMRDRLDEKIALLASLQKSNTQFAFADLRPLTPYYRLDIPVMFLAPTSGPITDTTTIEP